MMSSSAVSQVKQMIIAMPPSLSDPPSWYHLLFLAGPEVRC